MQERNKGSNKEHKYASEAYAMLVERKRELISFRRWLTGTGKGRPASLHVGCKLSELRKQLEALFQEGMNWNNYGEVWCVAHIVPLRLFDLHKERQQALAWSQWNLLPMFMDDNERKEVCLDISMVLLDAMPVNEVTLELRTIIAPHMKLLVQYREILKRIYK